MNIPDSFYEASIALIPKPDKDITNRENYRPISLIYIVTKMLNNILVNWIHNIYKKIMYHNQVEFILRMKGWFNIWKSISVIHYINSLKKKNHRMMKKKIFHRIQDPDKNSQQTRNRRKLPKPNKGLLQKHFQLTSH